MLTPPPTPPHSAFAWVGPRAKQRDSLNLIPPLFCLRRVFLFPPEALFVTGVLFLLSLCLPCMSSSRIVCHVFSPSPYPSHPMFFPSFDGVNPRGFGFSAIFFTTPSQFLSTLFSLFRPTSFVIFVFVCSSGYYKSQKDT